MFLKYDDFSVSLSRTKSIFRNNFPQINMANFSVISDNLFIWNGSAWSGRELFFTPIHIYLV